MKTNAPSATANIVARNLAIIAADEKTAHLVSSETARLNDLFVQNFSRGGSLFLKRARQKWFQRLFRLYERLTIPGLALHHALRKSCIELAVRDALAANFAQVVILGGGLDTLALRLHKEFPGVSFIELDHPATQGIKRETIEKHNLADDNLTLIELDFNRQNLAETLAAHPKYLPQAKTIFVCEGVLMYLGNSEIEGVFQFVKNQNDNSSRFVFTFMERGETGKIEFKNSTTLVRIWLALKKEPFRWGLRREALNDFLKTRRFVVRELATAENLRERYLNQSKLNDLIAASGENICVCEIVRGA
jgi:methyltransferase (TIGR00027 family)